MRRWRLITFSLATGFITNVLIAWACATWSTSDQEHSNYNAPGVGWPAIPPADWPEASMWIKCTAFGMQTDGASANLQRLIDTRRADPSIKCHWMFVDQYGWPCLALSRRRETVQVMRTSQQPPLPWWIAGFETPRWIKPIHKSGIPVNPMWPGLIANTLLYSAITAGMCIAATTLRNRSRRRRNLCTHCAYPIPDPAKPCPECGRLPRA